MDALGINIGYLLIQLGSICIVWMIPAIIVANIVVSRRELSPSDRWLWIILITIVPIFGLIGFFVANPPHKKP